MEKITDVIVIGFGGAGAAAAIEAADAGLQVVLLEKMSKGGGATDMSGGVVYGAGTSVQKAAGIEDSA
ncbi:MAG: FAD-binding protein, partial [Dehalococcoidia bacterium]|nr:FAD-binding protein [Dehalococcoidia bacterium]